MGPGDELERTLERIVSLLLPESKALATLPFDHLLIETSGLVDPAPLVQTFFRADLSGVFRIDSVVTVIDYKHMVERLQRERKSGGDGLSGFLSTARESGRQIAFADLIVLNKCHAEVAPADGDTQAPAAGKKLQSLLGLQNSTFADADVLCDPSSAAFQSVVAGIRQLNPAAEILPCLRCAVPTVRVLERRDFDTHRMTQLLREAALPANNTSDAADSTAIKGRHDGHAIRAVTMTWPSWTSHSAGSGTAATMARTDADSKCGEAQPVYALPLSRLRPWIQQVVESRWQSLYRFKGLAWVVDDSDGDSPASWESTPLQRRLFVIQGVHAEVHGSFVEGAPEESAASGRVLGDADATITPALVLIGEGLDAAALRASFEHECLTWALRMGTDGPRCTHGQHWAEEGAPCCEHDVPHSDEAPEGNAGTSRVRRRRQ
jgi:G3E family GTPase